MLTFPHLRAQPQTFGKSPIELQGAFSDRLGKEKKKGKIGGFFDDQDDSDLPELDLSQPPPRKITADEQRAHLLFSSDYVPTTSPATSNPNSRRSSLHELVKPKSEVQPTPAAPPKNPTPAVALALTASVSSSTSSPFNPTLAPKPFEETIDSPLGILPAATPVVQQKPRPAPPKVERLQPIKKFAAEMVTDSRSLGFGVLEKDDSEGTPTTTGVSSTTAADTKTKDQVSQSPKSRAGDRGGGSGSEAAIIVPQHSPTPKKAAGKRANPSASGTLVISSPAVLRVSLPAKREAPVVKEISLSGIVLVYRDGQWVLRDEARAQDIPSLRDAPGLQEGLKVDDVDLPGPFIARYLYGDKKWWVCYKQIDQFSVLPVGGGEDGGEDGEESVLDDMTEETPLEVVAMGTFSRISTEEPAIPPREMVMTSAEYVTKAVSSPSVKLFAGLNELAKAAEVVLQWFLEHNTGVSGDRGLVEGGNQDPAADLSFLVRGRLCNALAELLLFGFKRRKLPSAELKSGGRVTLWDMSLAALTDTEQTWLNSCKMLNSDPAMGRDPDMKFRTFLCIHLKYVDLPPSFVRKNTPKLII